MPGSPNTSFIPKHTTNKIDRKNTPRQLFIGTIIVRVLFFAVLIASVGVFAYERKLSNELTKVIEVFTVTSNSFEADEEKLLQVISFDQRLAQVNDRFRKSFSLEALFKALEIATVSTVQIRELSINRESDSVLIIEADIETDSFDSVIFQRSVFENNQILAVTEFTDVKIDRNDSDVEPTPGNLSINTGNSFVVFNAKIKVDPSIIPAVVVSGQGQLSAPTPEPKIVSPIATSTDKQVMAPTESSNQEII